MAGWDGFLKIGHRGAAGHEAENTIASFWRAIALGVNAVELDVRRAKDGELVVIHDETLDRTTDGRGPVRDFTYQEISRLRAGPARQEIPRLEQVFDVFRRRTLFNVEVKEPQVALDVLKLAIKKDMADAVVLSGFPPVWQNLFAANSLARRGGRSLKISLCAKDYSEALDALVSVVCVVQGRYPPSVYALSLSRRVVGRDLMSRVRNVQKKVNLKIWVWTVNNQAEIQKFKNLGVDGIISDYPDRL